MIRKFLFGLLVAAGLVSALPSALATGTVSTDQLTLVSEQAPTINGNTDAAYRHHHHSYYRHYYSYYSYYRPYYSYYNYYRPYYRPYYWGN